MPMLAIIIGYLVLMVTARYLGGRKPPSRLTQIEVNAGAHAGTIVWTVCD